MIPMELKCSISYKLLVAYVRNRIWTLLSSVGHLVRCKEPGKETATENVEFIGLREHL